MDADDIRMKLDAFKQEVKERVQKYLYVLTKFSKGVEYRMQNKGKGITRLQLEIRKVCVVRTFIHIEELVVVATELEKVLGEFGETPYEPLKEEHEDGVSETTMEKQVRLALNNTLISFFRGNASNFGASSSSTIFGGCHICKGDDHLAITFQD